MKDKSIGVKKLKTKPVYQESTIKALNFETKAILLFTFFSFIGFITLVVSWLLS
jgi:hypothetical protein